MGSGARTSAATSSRKCRLKAVIESIDSSANKADLPEGTADRSHIEPGPLFKEIYSGIMDMENPREWRPLLQKEERSFLAYTTDIHTLNQFKIIHQTPQKCGTAFHHKVYLAAVDSLNV